jgi:hypothetical protein
MSAVRLASAMLLSILAAAAHGDTLGDIEPRSDRYRIEWSGMSLGEGTMTLSAEADGCFRYESRTRPVALVRWTYGSPREASRFCVRDGVVRPQSFEYVNDRRSKDNFRLDFDWSAGQVRTLHGGEMSLREIPDPAYDRFVIREVLRLWVLRHARGEAPAEAEFVMVDDDRIKAYRFAIGASEIVDTPLGRIQALRVDRIDERRPHHYWLDPARDFRPVKIEQLKDGKVELRMLLVSTGSR